MNTYNGELDEIDVFDITAQRQLTKIPTETEFYNLTFSLDFKAIYAISSSTRSVMVFDAETIQSKPSSHRERGSKIEEIAPFCSSRTCIVRARPVRIIGPAAQQHHSPR